MALWWATSVSSVQKFRTFTLVWFDFTSSSILIQKTVNLTDEILGDTNPVMVIIMLTENLNLPLLLVQVQIRLTPRERSGSVVECSFQG